MRKIGIYLIIIGVAILGFYFIYNNALNKRNSESIEDYINDTSILNNDDVVETTDEDTETSNIQSNNIVYTAILEIPKINLKKGVVDSTKNFKSINYAISVDNNSNYPNELGNFILYSHSGNSSISYFKNLYKVEINDDIYVYYNGIKYHYVIYDKYDIEKTGKAKVINLKDNKYITLITCNQSRKGYQIVLVGSLLEENKY